MSRANVPPAASGDIRMLRAKTRPYAIHKHKPAGNKLLKKWARRKYGRAVAQILSRDNRLHAAYAMLNVTQGTHIA